MATYLGIIAGLGAAGSSAYAASQANQGTQGLKGTAQRIGVTPSISGLQNYTARLLALNEGTQAPSFGQFVASGGKAGFQLQGAGQFTPKEAQQLQLVGEQNQPTPWFDPTQTNRLDENQVLFLGAQRAAKRRQGTLKGPLTPEELYYQLGQDITRKERTFRGKKPDFKKANRIGQDLATARHLQDRLREQMFGAPYAPGPYVYSGGVNPNDQLYPGGPNAKPNGQASYDTSPPGKGGGGKQKQSAFRDLLNQPGPWFNAGEWF